MVLLAARPRYYWDACAWISLIQQDATRFDSLSYVVEEAKNGKVEIWTSNFTLAEVYKRPCDGQQKGLTVTEDVPFEDFITQDFVTRVQVDFDVGILARRLLRQHPTIVKPQDGIHVATALLNNVDELHTYDRENLLGLSGVIERPDGNRLKICVPPSRPAPQQPQMLPIEQAIQDKIRAEEDAKNQATGTDPSGRS
ncbi:MULTISPECIES: type II toxin-antitoxin system VapC family toxin [unclassified Bradyrhizobium]|uniref:type II toxin-antitoxin system VapC family toxin n=1 Tax=unclassified Bradyrhizobium TaxID=2631580 RepID=UPI0028EC7394|nr:MULTISPECIES: PIN domain-containing protein [unclassified Bradyrhizobium]